MHGQFLVVQLESEHEGVLGRITSISSDGRLSSSIGEDYGLRAVAEGRPIPEDLREQYLKYRTNMRVLGVVRIVDEKLIFAPSHRRLPHVGSKVAFLSDEILREIAGHNEEGGELGFLAFGEFIHCGGDKRLSPEPWMQINYPEVIPKFRVDNLVARRSFVFARAGFGKSNLVKLLFSNLYRTTPFVEKRGGRKVPVGTLIFDPDGEYSWPDDKNRPGLCDVPELEDKVVVFTDKTGPSDFYHSFVANGVRLDIRLLRSSDVIFIALSPEKQEQQNVRKLRGLKGDAWRKLVNEIHEKGNDADETLIKQLLRLDDSQDAEMLAARANMTAVVKMLHDPGSQMIDMLLESLKNGKICIVDVSRMRGNAALILSGLLLQKIFNRNQEEFTKARPETIPVIAVVEEAQSVLNRRDSSGESPYISWVKEGRKYDLGAFLITQQPGSITGEILSQGDNWFVFHLLSAGDLTSVKRANAHFSNDLLSALLNEPIPGHGVFWSSAGGKSYPLSVRVLLFERMYAARDGKYNRPPGKTHALKLIKRFEAAVKKLEKNSTSRGAGAGTGGAEGEDAVDVFELQRKDAIRQFSKSDLINKIRKKGVHWRGIAEFLAESLPDVMQNRMQIGHELVPAALDSVFGKDKWDTQKRPGKSDLTKMVTYVFLKNVEEGECVQKELFNASH